MRYFGTEVEQFDSRDFLALMGLISDMKQAAVEGHFAVVQAGYRQAICQSTEYFGRQQAPRAVSYLAMADFYKEVGDETGFEKVTVLLEKMLLH